MIVNLYTKPLGKFRWKNYPLGYSTNPQDYDGIKPIINFSRERNEDYDFGRIVWFRNLFINNCQFLIDPIDIFIVNYDIAIVDGYHRLIGAILSNQEIIRCKVVRRIMSPKL